MNLLGDVQRPDPAIHLRQRQGHIAYRFAQDALQLRGHIPVPAIPRHHGVARNNDPRVSRNLGCTGGQEQKQGEEEFTHIS